MPRNTAPGDYFIPVHVIDEAGFEASTLLQVTVRGRGDVFMSTDTGLLNLDATAGEEASTVLRLTNFGTGDLVNIELVADKPSGWEVAFEVDSVESLPLNNQIDITTTVLPAADAIPGDYLVTLRANHPDTNASLELRVTVAQSTIWGWLGIVLVVLVILILGGLFVRLGRR
ncbi:MAG: NEW3 domain-containing protein [Chloroflexota bacterium]|nr:NEW3 domain-containing protein [Chloroflexota bacterium]